MSRKEKKFHFIYKTTNILSGRYYIGMHSTNNLDDGYLGSGNRLRLAIRKHGKENFKREIIMFCDSRKELRGKEEEIVSLDEIAKKNCMNMVVGGEGGLATANHTKKWLFEKWKEPEYRRLRSKEASERMKKNHQLGKMRYDTFSGKKHSDETKIKMSNSHKNIGVGNKNSQFGTCWITKNNVNKKIKKEIIQEYLSDGWKKGRTLGSTRG